MYQSTDEFLCILMPSAPKKIQKSSWIKANLRIFRRIHQTLSWMKDSLSIFWLQLVAVMKSDLRANNVFVADSEYSSFILLSCIASPDVL